ncbi:hypothetical protein Pse7367_2943 [Thalassoporum mexicanum PCC 7367]|uniref:hypothetical protein n=1 Tax=Thalassoporum mexicanum TaxID=3457544 RepID=UPI00029F8DD7|nr:hypothetical protein [Pseudanabaena sp. PCC 7367]AFY71195.1 hypothetical protein Pse7367_2943 [Pseudanabaena sp. PCC 7367]
MSKSIEAASNTQGNNSAKSSLYTENISAELLHLQSDIDVLLQKLQSLSSRRLQSTASGD